MKRAAFILSLLLSAGAVAWSSFQAPAEEAVNFASSMPYGAVLYLQARDFSQLLRDWNQSTVKENWLKSDDFAAFSQSHLVLRLQEAQKQFAIAAGLPPGMNFLSQATGKQSAFAFYDIGNLEFLYLSRIPSADATQSVLWQSRAKFEPRSAGGTPFYVRTDPQSHRVVAFAVVRDTLLLATREDLLAGALEAMAGGKEPKLSDEDWFRDALASAHEPGDLRLVLNFDKLVESPHFHSYWIQRNVGELRQFSAGISDLYRGGDTYREERVFLRAENAKSTAASAASGPTPQGQQATAELLASVSADAGFYRAVSNPTPQESLALVANKLLSPRTTAAPPSTSAPSVQLTGGETGSAADLETRIDQPAVAVTVAAADHLAALRQLFEKAGILSQLQLESTRRDPQNSFIGLDSTIVLASSNNWDSEAVRAALQSAVSEVTTQSLGVGWLRRGKGANERFELDGQFLLALAVRGRNLILSNRGDLIDSALVCGKTAGYGTDLSSAARVNFSRERDNFIVLSRILDNAGNSEESAPSGSGNAPAFFSGNLGSLLRTLSAVKSESVVTRESEGKILQTVTYQRAR
jgi:hypothetical protein